MLTAAYLALAVSIYPQVKEPVDFDRLVAVYKGLNLPLPPAGSKLVAQPSGSAISGGDRESRMLWKAVYLVSAANGGHVVWSRGTESAVMGEVRPLTTDRASFVDVRFGLKRGRVEMRGGIEFAVIEWWLGNHAMAEALVNRSDTNTEPGQQQRLERAIAAYALDFWKSQIVHPTIDRSDVVLGYTNVIRQFPDLASESTRKTLDALRATATRNVSTSLREQLVDGLCELRQDAMGYPGAMLDDETPDSAPVLRIIDEGFDIVPTLVRHVDDPRYTRAYNSVSFSEVSILTVGRVCRQILEAYGAPSMETKDKYEAWLKDTRKTGYKQYVHDRLASSTPNGSPVLARVASKRYPDILLKALNKALEAGSGRQISFILQAIKDRFSAEVYLRAAEAAAQHANLSIQVQGLGAIRSVDAARYDTLLGAALRRLPASAKDLSGLETSLAQLVALTDNPLVWQELIAAAKRSEVTLRLNLIGNVRRADQVAGSLRQFDAFYLSFLDDLSPLPDNLYGRQVRDHVALLASREFEQLTAPAPSASFETWAQFRDNVRSAIKSRN